MPTLPDLRESLRDRVESTRFVAVLNAHLLGLPPPPVLLEVESYVMTAGTLYEPHPLTDEEWAHLRRVVERTGIRYRERECYYNGQRLAAADPTGQIVYCEGYGRSPYIDTRHGWAVLHGKVIDPTWRLDSNHHTARDLWPERNLGTYNPALYGYLGVEFPNVDWGRYWTENSGAGSVLEISPLTRDEEHGLPLLRAREDAVELVSIGPGVGKGSRGT